MEYSEKYNFYLPSRDGDDIADVNQISDNFRIIEENIPSKIDLDDAIENAKIDVDQSYDMSSTNAQSGIAVEEAIGQEHMRIVEYTIPYYIDQSYSAESTNAQSGIAVKEAINLFDLSKKKNSELIATIKVTPDANGNLPTTILFTTDSNGKAFELTDFSLSCILGATDGSAARFLFYVNDKVIFGNTNLGATEELRQWHFNYINLGEKGIIGIGPPATALGATHPNTLSANISTFMGGSVPPFFTGFSPVTSIKLQIITGTVKTFINGSEIKLYGVRK